MRYLDQKLKLVVNKDNYHVFSFSGTHGEVIYIEQHKVKRLWYFDLEFQLLSNKTYFEKNVYATLAKVLLTISNLSKGLNTIYFNMCKKYTIDIFDLLKILVKNIKINVEMSILNQAEHHELIS